jgi:transketolase N-terminal domain/subunit
MEVILIEMKSDGIYCSTGSLGLGITVAVGRALANKNKKSTCFN